EPQAGADPHHADALILDHADPRLYPFGHLVAEPPGMVERPGRSAMPLRDHYIGNLLGNPDRAPGRTSNQRAGFLIDALLLVDPVHIMSKAVPIKALA